MICSQYRGMRRWVLVMAAIALLAAGGLWLRQQLQIDGCLDHGGQWNYDADSCELATQQ
jgi:hypothetical protein